MTAEMEQSPKQSPAPVVEQAMKPCEACNGTGQFQGIFSSDPNWPPCPRCSSLLRMPSDPDWYAKTAAMEGDLDVSAGSPISPAEAGEVEPVAWKRGLGNIADSIAAMTKEWYDAKPKGHIPARVIAKRLARFSYPSTAATALQAEVSELRAKLAEAWAAAFEEAAQIASDYDSLASEAIRARAVKGAGQS